MKRRYAALRIVIAPDSFKESLSALCVAQAIQRGMRRVLPTAVYTLIPMADGGEGTTAALVNATGGTLHYRMVTGPRGKPVRAAFGMLSDRQTAVVEMAAASGLPLLPVAARNPLLTTSFGTGELLRHALQKNPRRVIIGAGGSATVDGGAGMAQALGAEFFDRHGRRIMAPLSGGSLNYIQRIGLDNFILRRPDLEVLIACDVRNPLLGARGAAAIFGPQKGASRADVRVLERNLWRYGQLLESTSGVKVLARPGAGAGGGLAASVLALAHGTFKPGAALVMAQVGLAAALEHADVVITAEGRIDRQTLYGKVPAGVGKLAQDLGVPAIAIGGSLGPHARVLFKHGFVGLEAAVVAPMLLPEALTKALPLVTDAAERVACWLRFRLEQ